MKFHPDVLRCHEQFGGDLEDMQRRYDAPDALAAKDASLSEIRAELDLARKALEQIDATGKAADKYDGDRLSPEEVYMSAVSTMRSIARSAARALASQGEGEER